MKKITLIVAVLLCLLALVGCQSKMAFADDTDRVFEVKTATTYLNMNDSPEAYTDNTKSPSTVIGGFTFETAEAGPDLLYSPEKEMSNADYNALIDSLKETYGEPSHIDTTSKNGTLYQWVSKSGEFSLVAVYDESITNKVALCVR